MLLLGLGSRLIPWLNEELLLVEKCQRIRKSFLGPKSLQVMRFTLSQAAV